MAAVGCVPQLDSLWWYSFLSCPVLSCPVLSCPVLSIWGCLHHGFIFSNCLSHLQFALLHPMSVTLSRHHVLGQPLLLCSGVVPWIVSDCYQKVSFKSSFAQYPLICSFCSVFHSKAPSRFASVLSFLMQGIDSLMGSLYYSLLTIFAIPQK